MYVFKQSTLQTLWLLLLMVFVLGDAVPNTAGWAESQHQEVGLVSEYQPDVSDDDTSISTCLSHKDAGNLLSAILNITELLAPVSGSDAYPSVILHGPPVPDTTA